jgi:hypothetical protein
LKVKRQRRKAKRFTTARHSRNQKVEGASILDKM